MSGESEFVDVTYRGLAVAHKARLRDVAGEAGFVEVETPLPVGSRIVLLRVEGAREASVTGVVEQEAGAKSPPGMRVSWASVSAAAPAPDPAATLRDLPVAAASSGEVPEAVDDSEGGMSGPIDTGTSTSTDGKKRRGGKKKGR